MSNLNGVIFIFKYQLNNINLTFYIIYIFFNLKSRFLFFWNKNAKLLNNFSLLGFINIFFSIDNMTNPLNLLVT